MGMESEFLDLRGAALLLGRSAADLDGNAIRERVPFSKTGSGKKLFRRSDLLHILKQRSGNESEPAPAPTLKERMEMAQGMARRLYPGLK